MMTVQGRIAIQQAHLHKVIIYIANGLSCREYVCLLTIHIGVIIF